MQNITLKMALTTFITGTAFYWMLVYTVILLGE